MFTQLTFNSIMLQMSKKDMVHQIDSKNEWLLLSETFTAKFELVFVLTFENAFSQSFHVKANRRIMDSSTQRY